MTNIIKNYYQRVELKGIIYHLERKEGVKAYKKNKVDFEILLIKLQIEKQVNVSKVNSNKIS